MGFPYDRLSEELNLQCVRLARKEFVRVSDECALGFQPALTESKYHRFLNSQIKLSLCLEVLGAVKGRLRINIRGKGAEKKDRYHTNRNTHARPLHPQVRRGGSSFA